jgi:fructose-specific phosphotransferase system IIA component
MCTRSAGVSWITSSFDWLVLSRTISSSLSRGCGALRAAVAAMVDAFYISGRTDDRHSLEKALWARETMGSTGVGYGFAIPHCKSDAVTANSISVLRLNEAINWDSGCGDRVSMVVLLALRESDPGSTHMQVFSSLARKLMNDEFRQHLLKTQTPHDVKEYLGSQLGIAVAMVDPVSS